jgi:hypothetical protein
MKSYLTLTLLALLALVLTAQEAPKKIAANTEPAKSSQPVVKANDELHWLRYENAVRKFNEMKKLADAAQQDAELAYKGLCQAAGAKTTDLCQPSAPNEQAPDYADLKCGKVTIIAEQPKSDAKPDAKK